MIDRIDFLAKFINESELIDNRCSSYAVIKEEIEKNKKDGHVGAILYLEKRADEKEIFITEEDIKKTHELIFRESEIWSNKNHPEWAGKYREGAPLIGELGGISPEKIPRKMEELIKVLNKCQMLFLYQKKRKCENNFENKVELISNFHYHFGIVNPFYNCNGRVNRALLFYLLKYFYLPPFVITYNEKPEYLGAFIAQDPQLLYELFLKKINQQKEPA
ncbi:MAG: Fic family protein [Patescibacteria group bacterium]